MKLKNFCSPPKEKNMKDKIIHIKQKNILMRIVKDYENRESNYSPDVYKSAKLKLVRMLKNS